MCLPCTLSDAFEKRTSVNVLHPGYLIVIAEEASEAWVS